MGLDIYFHKTSTKEIGYFRKVNFLVKFFDDKLNKEIENCSPIRVYKDDIEELLDICELVLKDHSKAEELLPCTQGFFFGNQEYNDDYFSDVEAVRNYVKNVLLPEFDELNDGESIEFEIWY